MSTRTCSFRVSPSNHKYISIDAEWGFRRTDRYTCCCRRCQSACFEWKGKFYSRHPSGWWEQARLGCNCKFTDRLGCILANGTSFVTTVHALQTYALVIDYVVSPEFVKYVGYKDLDLEICDDDFGGLSCGDVVSARAFHLLRKRMRPFLNKLAWVAAWKRRIEDQSCLLAFFLHWSNASTVHKLRCCSRSSREWCRNASSWGDVRWVEAFQAKWLPVLSSFTLQAMLKHDPAFAHTVCYPALGALVRPCRNHTDEDDSGWMFVQFQVPYGRLELRWGWIHPCIVQPDALASQ